MTFKSWFKEHFGKPPMPDNQRRKIEEELGVIESRAMLLRHQLKTDETRRHLEYGAKFTWQALQDRNKKGEQPCKGPSKKS